MDRRFGVDMMRLGRMMMRVVGRLCSRGMCREDAERVFAGQGEGEGGLLCRRGLDVWVRLSNIEKPFHLRRRELLKVLCLTTPHLGPS